MHVLIWNAQLLSLNSNIEMLLKTKSMKIVMMNNNNKIKLYSLRKISFHLTAWHNGHQWTFNTLRPRQNGRRFVDDTFKRIFLNDNARISLNILLKFVPKVRINNIPALVQIMAWRLPGDKPLSEAVMVRLSTHMCVARPQWVNHAVTKAV